jgi:hypothetical protein
MSGDSKPGTADDSGGIVQRRVAFFPDGTCRRRDAALYCGLTQSTLAHHARRGTGPKYFIFQGRAFYRRTDLDVWKAANTRVVEPKPAAVPADEA